jgi:YegS/Rv2252/BmrU family lipid kinase
VTLALIVNPFAGGGRAGRELHTVQAALSRLGLDHHVETTRSLDHARELALAAADAGEMAVAFGGDGLIGAVAEALCHRDGVLGALPGGRGNDLVRALGIPLQLTRACDVLATGTVGRIDLGQVGARTFIGIASCGLDSIANRIANETTLIRGNIVYAYAALRAVAGWRAASFTIRVDGGETRVVSGFTVAAANSSYYGGGMRLAPHASLTDGKLDLVIIHRMPKLKFLALLPTVFRGTHIRYPHVEVLRGATIELASTQRFTLYADGDPIAQLPVTINVLPGAVQAMLPAPAGAAVAAA